MKINKPIFILGAPRSGTTILSNLFTRHKDTAFPEHFLDKYYQVPWKFKLIPLMLKQQIWRYKKRPFPHEGKFWRKYFPPSIEVDDSQITPEIKNYIFSAIKTQLKAFHAPRYANKQVDFCLRIKFLKALFPDAYYIVIWRDPKSVVGSLFIQMNGEWKKDEKSAEIDRGWLRVTEDFGKNEPLLESCINFYKHYINPLKKNSPLIKDHLIEIKYEDLVQQPREELKRLYEFTELSWYKDLEVEIPKILQLGTNEKWKSLSQEEKQIIEKNF